jgi:arabinogalactan oligomer/maltooligosaccharide transport system substrate-binding protein
MYHINAWVTAYGGFFYDEATKELGFTKPETAEGIKFFIANIYRYVNVLAGVDHTTQRNLFGEGKTPFYISGPWDVSYAVKTLGVGNFAVVPLPKIGDKVPKPFAGFRNLYITNMAVVGAKERQYAVALFILYMALDNDAIITLVNECGYVPVKISVAEYIIQHLSENPLYPVIKGFYRQLVNAVPMPKDKNMQSVWGADTPLAIIWQTYANKLQETNSVDQAVEAAKSVVDQALQDAYNQVAPKIEK